MGERESSTIRTLEMLMAKHPSYFRSSASGVSKSFVEKHFQTKQEDYIAPPKKRLNEKEIEGVKARLKNYDPPAEIADEFGTGITTIYRIAMRNKIPMKAEQNQMSLFG